MIWLVGDKILMVDFFLGITNKCNLQCPWCAHVHLRKINLSYEMKLEEFESWYNITKKAGYYFRSIDFNGLGEPTLYNDIDILRYMLVKCRYFTNEINVLTNGTRPDIVKKIVHLCDNINVSVWGDAQPLDKIYPSKVHMRKSIELHDMRRQVRYDGRTGKDIACGCSGCGYTMGIIFLVCGTWCPEIRLDDIHHTILKDDYLSYLDKNYGTASFGMCARCWGNTSIPYNIYKG